MGTPALVALGSNLGDRKANLDSAVASLSAIAGVTVLAVSSYHETEPVGGPSGQGAFLNAAAALETTLDPLPLLDRLHQTEHAAGRQRSVRWGERTLDLDLILHADRVIDTPELRLPHPRMWVRRFVLAPLAEIAPGAIDPSTGQTVRQLLDNLDRRPACVAVVGDGSEALCRWLTRASPADGLFLDEPVTDDRYAALSDPLFADETDWYAVLDRTARAFEARRPTGERWVVIPFWFDLIYRDALPYVIDPDLWHERFLSARARVIRPTFVVATNPYSYAQLRLWNDLNRDLRPVGVEVPLFWPRPEEPFTTLSGLDWTAMTRLITPGPEEVERMGTEVASALASTRAG